MKQKILVTGSSGFVAGYLVEELLNNGYEVVGIDNFSKYGKVEKSYDNHPNYHFAQGDVKDTDLMKKLLSDCGQAVALAAMVGGIAFAHDFAYDLFAENEKITISTFDAALWAFKNKNLKKINIISSSMVFENSDLHPIPEGEQLKCPAPSTTYGFQKLSCEYFARAAFQQYKLPFTIIRPFNCIGIGEKKARQGREIKAGNIKSAMSHVIPDLILKILSGQDPLHILGAGDQVRHYTYGGDLALGIRLCIESEKAINQDFNLSSEKSTTVLELAELIWKKINGLKPFNYVSDPPFPYDVKKNVPDITKAKKLLGFEAKTSLSEVLDEIIPWVKEQIKLGAI